MSAMSRTKGKTAEREMGHLITAAGFPYLREQDGRTQGADFRIGDVCLEVKRRERLNILEWHRELEAKTPEHLTPVVAWRTSREPWRVSLTLQDFLDLLGETRA